MKAAPRKILKTFSHETNIHTNSEFIGDLTKPKLHLVSVVNRTSYHFEGLYGFSHAYKLKKYTGDFHADIVQCIDMTSLTHCTDSIIIFFNGDWNDYNHAKIYNNVVIDSSNNIIYSDNKDVKSITGFNFEIKNVDLSDIKELIDLSGCHIFKYEGIKHVTG